LTKPKAPTECGKCRKKLPTKPKPKFSLHCGKEVAAPEVAPVAAEEPRMEAEPPEAEPAQKKKRERLVQTKGDKKKIQGRTEPDEVEEEVEAPQEEAQEAEAREKS